MKKTINLGAFFIVFGLFAANLLAVQVTLLGPKQYVRTDGPPNIFTESFSGRIGAGTIIVKNGAVNGTVPLSSAIIKINGIRIFGPSDFNQKVRQMERVVSLQENNSISIELRSKPGSYLSVEIQEEINAVTKFQETFESSSVGSIPNGWYVENPGSAIAVSDNRVYDGTQSLFMQGVPYGGANLLDPISSLNINSGAYTFSFYMSVDTSSWVGDDGVAIGHLEVSGKIFAMGVRKVAGVYNLVMYGSPEIVVPFPGNPNAWAKYEVRLDFSSDINDYYLNGANVGSNSPSASSAPDRVHLATGDAGQGGGTPSAYFDLVKIEKR